MASIAQPNDPASRAFRRFREHGDPAAMTEVFDLIGQELFALAAHIARDAAEAEDLVQEVFLAALAGARRFDPSRAVTPWLVGILVKEARKTRRGRARREGSRAERTGPRVAHGATGDATQRAAPTADAPLAQALTGEVRRAITLALEDVPTRYREVLRPVLEDGVAPTALAATLGRAPGTVRMQLHRGLELLRKALPHTLAPALVPPLVSSLALELGAGRGLAAIRADLARRAALEGPGLALASAGVLVTSSLPLLGVVVMQTKVLAAVAATALVGIALLVQQGLRAQPDLDLEPRRVTAAETALVAAASVASESMEGARSFERSAVAATDADTAQASMSTTATLTVGVVDEDGAGVAGAWVEVRTDPNAVAALRPGAEGEFKVLQSCTRADGRVTFEVRAGFPLELRGCCFDYTSVGTVLVGALAGGARTEATIAVRTRSDDKVTGRVVDASSGEPIAGIHVHLQQVDGSDQPKRPLPPRAEPDAVTDAAGEFRVPAMSWKRCFVLCTGAGWSPRLVHLNRPTAAGQIEDTPVTIALLRAARIEGSVTGAGGSKLALVEVCSIDLVDFDQPNPETIDYFNAQYELEAAVDGGGHFTFDSAPVLAELSLTLADAATRELLLLEPDDLDLAPGTTHAVTWSIGAGGSLVVRVRTEDGAPAPDEELWLLTGKEGGAGETEPYWTPTFRAHTDPLGSATFDDLRPGSWLVALARARTPRDPECIRYAVWATIPALGAVVPVDLTLFKGLYISGTVRAPDGTPRATYVQAEGEGLRAYVQAHDCKGGAFRLGPLKRGRYALVASGSIATAAGEAPLTNSSVVHVEAGTTDVEVLLGGGADLVLAAVDRSSGAPVPALFGCWRVGEEGATWMDGRSNSRPLMGLAPGPHLVLARTDDGRIGVTEVEVVAGGRAQVTVEVADGGRVRVRHGGSAGRLNVSLEGGLGPLGVAEARPTEVAELLAPPGEYTLHLLVRAPNIPAQTWTVFRDERRKVTVTAGGVIELEL